MSFDNGWKEYCAASDVLVVIDDFAQALNWFQSEAAVHSVRMFARTVARGDPQDVVEQLRDALERHKWKIAFHVQAPSDYSYEDLIEDVRILEIDENYLRSDDSYVLVDVKSDEMIVSLTTSVQFEVDCHFTFSKWDSGDAEYIDMGSLTATSDVSTDVTFMLSLADQGNNLTLRDVEVTKGAAVVEFGEVEPDWL